MTEIQVNLKRFDVPISAGGICPSEVPADWIKKVIAEVNSRGLEKYGDLRVILFPPEALLPAAQSALQGTDTSLIELGSQGVYFEDVQKGGNFGAFTTNLPAVSAVTYGCKHALIGHSEERKQYADIFNAAELDGTAAVNATNSLLAKSVHCAFQRGLKVTYCVGETAAERVAGENVDVFEQVRVVLSAQLEALSGIAEPDKLVIGYEPRWAIGPGKTPPGAEEIGEIVSIIKELCTELFGVPLSVIYGGGLKEENAEPIGSLQNIDGGLIALTKFTGQIAFDPVELEKIVELFMKHRK